MVKAPKITGNKGNIWAAWLLATAGFGILLAGVASMQSMCSANVLNTLTSVGGGSVGYLAPVSCGHFFQYTWWILVLHFFAWCMVLAYLLGNLIHKNRAALVGILAVAAVLLMDTANTYLMVKYLALPGTGTLSTRAKLTVAGAIIAAVADLLLILAIGWHDDKTTLKEQGYGRAVHDTTPGYGAHSDCAGTTGYHTGTVPASGFDTGKHHNQAPVVPATGTKQTTDQYTTAPGINTAV